MMVTHCFPVSVRPVHIPDSLNPRLDGRVSISLADNQVEIKYQQLNPATHFTEVVDAARSVVLAGGTMSPVRTTTL